MIDEHPMSCPTQKTEKVQNNAKNTQSMKTPIK